MRTITVFLSTIFFLTSIVNPQSMVSERLTSEKAFLYYLSIYGFQLSDTPRFRGDTWIEKYLRKFEKDKYNNVKNDEFLKNDFMSNAKSNLSNKINSLDFNKKYSTFRRGTLGEYDFNRQGFPVYIQMFKRLKNILFSFDNLYLEFYWFVNDNEFDYFIRMSPEDAKQFIIKRKDPKTGKVNRRISANLIYSVTKVPLIESGANDYKATGLVGYIYTIYIKPTRNSTEVLGKLLPEEEYYNIINGIKIENGQQIVYYDKSWNVVNDKVDAAYYTLVNYKSGKIKNPIIDYYITGEIQMKGYYKSYNRKEKIRHGLFTWYYKSGKIKNQAKYIDNKRVIE